VVGTNIDIQEINHFPEADAVHEITEGTGKNQREGKRQHQLLGLAFPDIMENQDNRRHRHGHKKEVTKRWCGRGQKTEGRPGIPDISDAEESLDHGKGFMQHHG